MVDNVEVVKRLSNNFVINEVINYLLRIDFPVYMCQEVDKESFPEVIVRLRVEAKNLVVARERQ